MLDSLRNLLNSLLDFLDTNYFYGNTWLQWVTALFYIVLFVGLSVAVFRLLTPIFRKAARKTETKLDDVFLEVVGPLITAIIILYGVWLTIQNTLTISELDVIRLGVFFQVFIPFLFVAWLIIKLIEALHKNYNLSVKYVIFSKALFVFVIAAGFVIINYIRITQTRDCYLDCTGANLVNASLNGQDLSGASLIEANLRDADMRGTNLRGADLSGANLIGANLSGADLSGAALIGADLSRADLREANLSSTDLSGATLINADLTRIDLTETRLRGVIFDQAQLIGTDISEVNLIGASFLNANMSGIHLDRADLSGASLSGSNLSSGSFVEADLRGSSVNLADLNGADFRGATLVGTSLVGSNLASADLSNSNMNSAVLVGANLNGANVNSADLSDVQLFIAELNIQDLQRFDPGYGRTERTSGRADCNRCQSRRHSI